MSKIDDITIRRVTEAADIVDVIGEFVPLKSMRQGRHTCLCPFHADKHEGNFVIGGRKNIYFCYSCGANGGVVDYLMKAQGMTFPDAIRWLGRKYGIPVEGSENMKVRTVCKPRPIAPRLPTYIMQTRWVNERAGTAADENILVKWLRSLPWDDEQRKRLEVMLRNYKIGHSPKGGHTIFWQIDHEGHVLTGKMMLYKPDGHRDKTTPHNFDWIHSRMIKAGKLDPLEYDVGKCLFGQHLMRLAPGATINIVESEKTAIIVATATGNMRRHLWMATGGLQFLSKSMLTPLIREQRDIVLYPDHDGIVAWKEKAQKIIGETGYDHIYVNEDWVTVNWLPEDGEKADIADIILRLIQPNHDPMSDLKKQYPEIAMLDPLFDLEIVQEKWLTQT